MGTKIENVKSLYEIRQQHLRNRQVQVAIGSVIVVLLIVVWWVALVVQRRH